MLRQQTPRGIDGCPPVGHGTMTSVEGRPLVVDEAKYLLKPVVASNIGAHRDLIEHGQTGLITERNPENTSIAIKRVLSDENLIINIKNNLENNRFNDKNVAETVEKLWLL